MFGSRVENKKRFRVGIAATLTLFFGIILPAAPAYAASSMDWEARIKFGVYSREVHTSKNGSITVTASAYSCDHRNTTSDSMKVWVRLEHMSWVWNPKGSFSVRCGSSGKKTWTNMPKGSYRLWISKSNDGGYLTASGRVSYP